MLDLRRALEGGSQEVSGNQPIEQQATATFFENSARYPRPYITIPDSEMFQFFGNNNSLFLDFQHD